MVDGSPLYCGGSCFTPSSRVPKPFPDTLLPLRKPLKTFCQPTRAVHYQQQQKQQHHLYRCQQQNSQSILMSMSALCFTAEESSAATKTPNGISCRDGLAQEGDKRRRCLPWGKELSTPTTTAGSPLSCWSDSEGDYIGGRRWAAESPLAVDPVADPTAYLCCIKAAVGTTSGASAVRKAAERYDQGAMLSADSDSQGSVCSSRSVSSASSSRACVDAKLNPASSRQAMRQLLITQGNSLQQVDFEMRGRPSTDKVKANQRRRKQRYDAWLMRRKRSLQNAQDGASYSTLPQMHLIPQQLKYGIKKNHHNKGAPSSKSNDMDHNVKQQQQPRRWTRDQRIAEARRQKQITAFFAQLQNMRDVGEISMPEFEAEKRRVFRALFEEGPNGRLRARRSNWHAADVARRAVFALRTRAERLQRCAPPQIPAWRPESGLDEDVRLEFSFTNGIDLPRRGSCSTVVEGPSRSNQDLRQMLMRRIDQRAPPFARLFRQEMADDQSSEQQCRRWMNESSSRWHNFTTADNRVLLFQRDRRKR